MTNYGKICDVVGHSRSYYQPMFAVCAECHEYNKEFERYDDYRDISEND